jgi:hypothetical protein
MMPSYRLYVDGERMGNFDAANDDAAAMWAADIVRTEVAGCRSAAICVTENDMTKQPTDPQRRIVLFTIGIEPKKKPKVSAKTKKHLRAIHNYWHELAFENEPEPDLIYALDHVDATFEVPQVPAEKLSVIREEIDDLAKQLGGLTEIIYLTGDIDYPRGATIVTKVPYES